MANTKQAKKRARQNITHNMHNASLRSKMRTLVKKVLTTVSSGNKEAIIAAYREASSFLDKLANKKVIHKNKAARHKSNLSKRIKALEVV